jgi:hypothetical protein
MELEREVRDRLQLLEGRSECEEFPFRAEKSAQSPGAGICVGIAVLDDCNASTDSLTSFFGIRYTRRRGLRRRLRWRKEAVLCVESS